MTKLKVFSISILLFLLVTACDVPPQALEDPESFRKTLEAIGRQITPPLGIVPGFATPSPENILQTGQAPNPAITGTSTLESGNQTTTPIETQSLSSLGFQCNLAAPGLPIDVSIPDGAVMEPGMYFTKIWRITNSGTCTWLADYSLIWFSGESFGVPPSIRLGRDVPPGTEIDLAVDMVAPRIPGNYQGNWKLQSTDGQLFGIGPGGDAPIWVKIQVVVINTATPEATPNPTVTPQVVFSGETILNSGDRLDVDGGQLAVNPPDIQYLVDEDGEAFLLPENGARLVFVGVRQPGEKECRLAVMNSEAVNLTSIPTPAYFCYRSSQGLPGSLYIEAASNPGKALKINFITWFVP